MLTKTNYPERALVMEVNFQILRVWDAVDDGIGDDLDEDEYHADRQAMAGLLRSVLSDMWSTLARKETVKEAWDAVKTLRIGDKRAATPALSSSEGSSTPSCSRMGRPSPSSASASPRSPRIFAPTATTSPTQR
jgi:hypothetical protein